MRADLQVPGRTPDPETGADASGKAGSLLLGSFFKRMLDELYDGVYFVDVERRILYWNKAAEQISGYAAWEVVGRTCFDNILEHTDADGCSLCHRCCPLVISIRSRKAICKRVSLKHKEGHRVVVEVRTSPVADEGGRIVGAVEVFRDAGAELALESAYRSAREMAARDSLTGLANRRCLTAFVSEQLALGSRSDRRFSLILLDVDRFKEINDELGHGAGDRVLAAIGRAILASCRETDLAGRYGGDEFAIILPGTTLDRASGIAERMRAEIAAWCGGEVAGHPAVTASLGLAESLPDDTWDTMLARADAALYEAKRRGRNRVAVSGLHPQGVPYPSDRFAHGSRAAERWRPD
ncbi:MAG: diguanylate cyclase [Isosphaeraceae bacterium]